MISYSANIFVVAGALLIIFALKPTRQLIVRLPKGGIRHSWHAMLVLEVVFFLGYLGYASAFWNTQSQLIDLIVPTVFFLGACFVWLTATLSLKTTVAIERISFLEKENMVDPLTEAFNRRVLDRCLKEEVTRARRYELPLSVLLLDIDHFKQINDKHGHRAGDQVLISFAKLIKRELRELISGGVKKFV